MVLSTGRNLRSVKYSNMDEELTKYNRREIENRIFSIRDKQVILYAHLAEMYKVETKYLNRAAKRNQDRFPNSFRFQFIEEEFENLKVQIGTSSQYKSLRFQIGTLKHQVLNVIRNDYF